MLCFSPSFPEDSGAQLLPVDLTICGRAFGEYFMYMRYFESWHGKLSLGRRAAFIGSTVTYIPCNSRSYVSFK